MEGAKEDEEGSGRQRREEGRWRRTREEGANIIWIQP